MTNWMRVAALFAAFGLLGSVGVACDDDEEAETAAAAEETASTETAQEPEAEPVEPLPEDAGVEMEKVLLGRALFHDNRLSGDETLSCATCHSLDQGGAESRAVSKGIGDQLGPINSPTVLNARFNFRQFWDGRAADLVEQAGGPVENPIEMGASWDQVLPRLKADEEYTQMFASVYGGEDPITKEHVLDAIAEYEEYLITPSPFDAYLRGDEDAISAQAKRGYALFKETGCTSCHMGVNIGGTMYQKMGLVHDYFSTLDRELAEADYGRFNVTENEADKFFFKVPTLRNVELTAPYFHDASAETLEDAVRKMGYHQLGKELSEEQVADIVAFLKSLTGELPSQARMPAGEGEGTEGEDSAGEAPEGETAG